MPESTAFTDEANIVDRFDDATNAREARRISDRWTSVTVEIGPFIEESRIAHDFYLRNRPERKSRMKQAGQKLDSANTNPDGKGLRLGFIPRAVDSVMAMLMKFLFPPDERFFRGTPQNKESERNQEMYEQHLMVNFAEENTTEKWEQCLKNGCLDRAYCMSLHWKQKITRKITYKPKTFEIAGIEIPIPLLGLEKTIDDNFVEWEGTVHEPLDFTDWRVDPTARNFEDSWFMRRWYEPVWEVKRKYGLKDVQPYHAFYSEIHEGDGSQKRDALGFSFPIQPNAEPDGKDKALLMIMWDDFIINGKIYENHAALVLNGTKLIWFGPNPYDHGRKPYIVDSLLPVPGQIYGLSLVHHSLPSASTIDTIVDKTLKIGSFAADPIFEVDMMEPALRKTKVIKAGMTIPVKRVGQAIRQVPINISNLTLLLELMQRMEDNIRELTGASPLFTGEDLSKSPSNITAFHVDQHIQGANSRFQAIMRHFSNCVLEPALKMVFENERQFKTKTEYIETGGSEKELTPDLIKQLDYKWVITSANAANTRGKRLANMRTLVLEIFPQLVQNGLAKLTPKGMELDHISALREMMVLAGVPNVDVLLKTIDLPEEGGLPNDDGTALPEAIGGGAGPLPEELADGPSVPIAEIPDAGDEPA